MRYFLHIEIDEEAFGPIEYELCPPIPEPGDHVVAYDAAADRSESPGELLRKSVLSSAQMSATLRSTARLMRSGINVVRRSPEDRRLLLLITTPKRKKCVCRKYSLGRSQRLMRLAIDNQGPD